jgi:hypothetical protein
MTNDMSEVSIKDDPFVRRGTTTTLRSYPEAASRGR